VTSPLRKRAQSPQALSKPIPSESAGSSRCQGAAERSCAPGRNEGPQLVTIRVKSSSDPCSEQYRQLLPKPKGHIPLVRFLQGLGLSGIDAERKSIQEGRSTCERLAAGYERDREVSGTRPDFKVEKWLKRSPSTCCLSASLQLPNIKKASRSCFQGQTASTAQKICLGLAERFSGRVLSLTDQAVIRWGAISGEVKRPRETGIRCRYAACCNCD